MAKPLINGYSYRRAMNAAKHSNRELVRLLAQLVGEDSRTIRAQILAQAGFLLSDNYIAIDELDAIANGSGQLEEGQ